MKRIISNYYCTLLRCLDPSIELFGRLRSVEFVKDRVSSIKQNATIDDKNDALLKALSEVPGDQERVMNDFIAALNIFRAESYKVCMSDVHCIMLIKKTDELCKFLDPEMVYWIN